MGMPQLKIIKYTLYRRENKDNQTPPKPINFSMLTLVHCMNMHTFNDYKFKPPLSQRVLGIEAPVSVKG